MPLFIGQGFGKVSIAFFSHKKSLHRETPCGFPWSEITACEKISRLKVMETEVFKLRCCDAKSNKKPPV